MPDTGAPGPTLDTGGFFSFLAGLLLGNRSQPPTASGPGGTIVDAGGNFFTRLMPGRRLPAGTSAPGGTTRNTGDAAADVRPGPTSLGSGEPFRGSPKKIKRKKGELTADERIIQQLADQGIWPYTLFSKNVSLRSKIMTTIANAGLTYAMSGGGRLSLKPRLVMPGSRTSQRGFVRTMPSETEIELPSKPTRPPRAPVPHIPPVVQPLTQPDVLPATQPKRTVKRLQPLPTAPDTRPQDYTHGIDPSRIQLNAPTIIANTGPGSRAATTSTARSSTAPARQPARSTKTPAIPAIPSTPVGPLVLSPDALLRQMLRAATKRTPGIRQALQLGSAIVARPGQTAPGLALAQPLTQFMPQKIGRKSDTCECEKKPRKPRQPRSVCYRGTYRETAKGIVKSRGDQVPCS